MILDWQKFVERERPRWDRLAEMLEVLARDPWRRPGLEELRELDALYLRAAADLARLSTMAIDPATRRELEQLVARAYTEVHGGRAERGNWKPLQWLRTTVPQTFRRHLGALQFAFVLMLVGGLFGGLAVAFDPRAKEVIVDFQHLKQGASERVAKEEAEARPLPKGAHGAFAGQLMAHNFQVTLGLVAMGLTWGIGTVIMVFYNGVVLGAIAAEYMLDGQALFFCGWILPHGVVEIPAMLVGAQAGFVLARALLGRGQRLALAARMRLVVPDVVTLCALAGLMLVWAGFIESYFSQYHDPVIPYWLKILFASAEALALGWYLFRGGRSPALALKKDRA